MTSAHHAANGPSHFTSSTSPSAVPCVVSTKRQNSALSAAFALRQIARSVGEPLQACAATDMCRVRSGRDRDRDPLLRRTRRARIRRSESRALRAAHLSRVRRFRACARSFTRSKISAGALRDRLPRLFEVGLCDRDRPAGLVANRVPADEARTRARCLRARSSPRRDDARPSAERDRARLAETSWRASPRTVPPARRLLRRRIEPRRARVLEPELEIERIALGTVDRVGDGEHLEPAT